VRGACVITWVSVCVWCILLCVCGVCLCECLCGVFVTVSMCVLLCLWCGCSLYV